MAARLSVEEKQKALKDLENWSLHESREALVRTFRFRDFNGALGFMVRSGLIAEKMDHHPEWSNVYNRVDVTLITHDADGLTRLDLKLALAMDAIAAEMGAA